MCNLQNLSKVLVFLAAFACCALLMISIMSVIGLIVMSLYALGSFLLTASVDIVSALYVALDAAFILGGGLSFITCLLIYPIAYYYFNQRIQDCLGVTRLNEIPLDNTSHSTIDLNQEMLSKIAEHSSVQLKEEFQCPICFESMLFKAPKTQALSPITLRFISHEEQHLLNEQSYHQSCFLNWIKIGGQREPVLGVDLFNPEGGALVRYDGYNKRQRNTFRLFQASHESQENLLAQRTVNSTQPTSNIL